MKSEKVIGINGINQPILTIRTQETGLALDIEGLEDENMDMGFPNSLFSIRTNDFMEFAKYIHDIYDELKNRVDEWEVGDIQISIPIEEYVADATLNRTSTNTIYIRFLKNGMEVSQSIQADFIEKELQEDKEALSRITEIAHHRINAWRK